MALPSLRTNVKYLRARNAFHELGLSEPMLRGVLEMTWDAARQSTDPTFLCDSDFFISCGIESNELAPQMLSVLLEAGGPTRVGFLIRLDKGGLWVHHLYEHGPDYNKKRRLRAIAMRAGVTEQDARMLHRSGLFQLDDPLDEIIRSIPAAVSRSNRQSEKVGLSSTFSALPILSGPSPSRPDQPLTFRVTPGGGEDGEHDGDDERGGDERDNVSYESNKHGSDEHYDVGHKDNDDSANLFNMYVTGIEGILERYFNRTRELSSEEVELAREWFNSNIEIEIIDLASARFPSHLGSLNGLRVSVAKLAKRYPDSPMDNPAFVAACQARSDLNYKTKLRTIRELIPTCFIDDIAPKINNLMNDDLKAEDIERSLKLLYDDLIEQARHELSNDQEVELKGTVETFIASEAYGKIAKDHREEATRDIINEFVRQTLSIPRFSLYLS